MNNGKPIVSVIVTTYNRKELLKETIDSILNQTFTDFELIVVDNYSNYDFFAYMESFNDSRIRAFQNQNDGIIAVNRNVGIKKAKGEYIAFCDDDDYWEQNKLEEQINYFNNDSIVGIGTAINLINSKSNIIQELKKGGNRLLGLKEIVFNSVPFSSLIIKNIGILFDERESFIAVEDFDLQLNLVIQSQKHILYLSKPLTYYRVDSQHKSSGIQQKINCLHVVNKYDKVLDCGIKRKLNQLINYRIGKKYLFEM